jgi:hypothetical protein
MQLLSILCILVFLIYLRGWYTTDALVENNNALLTAT